jgi:DNA-binding MarR family transcriptional regulator
VTAPFTDEDRLVGLGFLLGVAHRGRRRVWEAQLSDLGISPPQAALLRLVSRRPGGGIRELARHMVNDPMIVQRLADTLVDKGLVETRADPTDARRRPLYLTVVGKQLAAVIIDRAADAEQQLKVRLGGDSYISLMDALSRLVEIDRLDDKGSSAPGTA